MSYSTTRIGTLSSKIFHIPNCEHDPVSNLVTRSSCTKISVPFCLNMDVQHLLEKKQGAHCLETVKNSKTLPCLHSFCFVACLDDPTGFDGKKTASNDNQIPCLLDFLPNPPMQHIQQLARIIPSQPTHECSHTETWQCTGPD